MERGARPRTGLKVTWSESKPNFPGHDKLHDHIRKAPIVKREIPDARTATSRKASSRPRASSKGEYEFPTQSHASTGPACAVADVSRRRMHDLDLDAEAALRRRGRRRSAGTAARKSAGDLDVRHRLLRPQRPGRRDRRRGRAVKTSRPAGARAIHAPRGHRLGPQGHGLGQPQPRRPRRLRQDHRLREHQQGVLAPERRNQRGPRRRRARRPSARRCRSSREQASKIPVASYTFDHRRLRLGDRAAADGPRLAAAHHPSARSLWPADPVRQRSRSWTRSRPRPTPIRSISGCAI